DDSSVSSAVRARRRRDIEQRAGVGGSRAIGSQARRGVSRQGLPAAEDAGTVHWASAQRGCCLPGCGGPEPGRAYGARGAWLQPEHGSVLQGAAATAQPQTWRWQGRSVKLLDGTTVSMPETPNNQRWFPQNRAQ